MPSFVEVYNQAYNRGLWMFFSASKDLATEKSIERIANINSKNAGDHMLGWMTNAYRIGFIRGWESSERELGMG